MMPNLEIGVSWSNKSAAVYISTLARAGVQSRSVTGPSGTINIQLDCPFCSDTRSRLGVTTSGLGHCFNCSWKSRHAWDLIFRQLQIVKQNVLHSGADAPPAEEAIEMPFGFQPLWQTLRSDMDVQARKYLRSRSISPAQIHKYHIGVVWTGMFAHRVVIPWWDASGQLITLVARDITGWRQPKYLSQGRKSLVGAPKRFSRIHLFEGIFKALRAELVLPDPTAAVLGAQLTQYQMDQLMAAGCTDVCIWPDPDRPGRIGAQRTAERLTGLGVHVRFAVMEKPADDASRSEIVHGYDQALKAVATGGSAWSRNMRLPFLAG